MDVSGLQTDEVARGAPAVAAIAVLTILGVLALGLDWIVPFTPVGRDLAFLMISTTAIGAVLTYACQRVRRLEALAPHVLLLSLIHI